MTTLTCTNAIAAALAVVGTRTDIASIEFSFGLWCPGLACLVSPPNTGHVTFHMKGLTPDLVVTVEADRNGTVTESSHRTLPSPSPVALRTGHPAPSGTAVICTMALISGTLVRDKSSGVALQVEGNELYPVLWPNGYVARQYADGTLTLLDEAGNPIAHAGDDVSMGGGFILDAKQTWAECPGSLRVESR